MALEKSFESKLETLWRRRTGRLRAYVVSRKVGQPAKFTKSIRIKLINDLLRIATEILLKREGRTDFRKIVANKYLKHIKGHGLKERGRRFLAWAKEKVKGPIIYSFWQGGSACMSEKEDLGTG